MLPGVCSPVMMQTLYRVRPWCEQQRSEQASVIQISPLPTYLFNSQTEIPPLKPFLWVRMCGNAQVTWVRKVTYESMNSQDHAFGFQITWEDNEQVPRGRVGSL